MNQVSCFCYSMHGCCIGSEYKPQSMKNYMKILAIYIMFEVAICNDAWLTRTGNPGNFLSGNFPRKAFRGGWPQITVVHIANQSQRN